MKLLNLTSLCLLILPELVDETLDLMQLAVTHQVVGHVLPLPNEAASKARVHALERHVRAILLVHLGIMRRRSDITPWIRARRLLPVPHSHKEVRIALNPVNLISVTAGWAVGLTPVVDDLVVLVGPSLEASAAEMASAPAAGCDRVLHILHTYRANEVAILIINFGHGRMIKRSRLGYEGG